MDDETERLLAEWKHLVAERRVQADDIVAMARAFLGTKRDGAQEAAIVIGAILGWFAKKPSKGQLKRLRAMVAQTEGLRERRVASVRAIRATAELIAMAPHGADRFVEILATRLSAEPGLSGVAEDLKSLRERVERVAPKKTRGKITAETALAEIIVEEQDALGIKVNDDEDEKDEIERIRKILVRDQQA